ncbi:SGNH/GDSL hydrolase family protein [Larkinella punicea]|uniref:SGNH/GDSL hydrolase family protein n=1 Tax=Larkinella punicea TaxID=2315727 RepID=UPI00105844CE|nr:SGNH/GDSL hydrolase family protein [Larkinella punicea]
MVGLWLSCYVYDKNRGNADGLIGNVAYNNVFIAVFILVGLGVGLSWGLTARQKTIQNYALLTFSGLFFIVFLEGIGHLVLGLKLVNSYSFIFRRFYISSAEAKGNPFPVCEIEPHVGRWRIHNKSYHFINCAGDSIHWNYNSVGANDRQRSIKNPDSTRKRVAVFGDSYSEGFMVSNSNRWSAVLEKQTRLEHLNFAISGAGPLDYYLIYKTIGKAYEADVLMIGFLPANDFETYTEKEAYRLVEWPSFMPYWQGSYPDYTLRYSLANVAQSIQHGDHTPASLLKVVDSVYSHLPLSGKLKADLLAHSSLFRLLRELNSKSYREGKFSRYEQFTEEEWNRVRYSLKKLKEEAGGKKVILLSIPILPDLKALKQGKSNRVDPLLSQFCQQNGIGFIPLAPSFLKYKGDPEQLYVSCDGHWTVQGEALAAEVIMNHPVYRSAVGLPSKSQKMGYE